MKKYKKMMCPVCREFEFASLQDDIDKEMVENGEFQCDICGCIYDFYQAENLDLKEGFNEMSVNEYRNWFKQKRKENPDYNYLDENISEPMPHKCPICGEYEFEDEDSNEICPICGWEDDGCLDEPMANEHNAEKSIKIFKEKRKKDPNYRCDKEFN